MPDCLFCKIVAKQIPAKVVHEDADCLAFEDISPQAPTHVLIVPKRHIATTNDVVSADEALVGHLVTTAAKLARDRGHADAGYRVVMNTNADAGQTVFHLHVHLLGGRSLAWPPG
jgi:histidine triad (HIT) family protein